MRKRRPPLTTAEIVAYNFGREGRRQGLTWEAFTPAGLATPMLSPAPLVRRVLSQRGPAFFSRWALRGYFEP
jgi:hypothetical protein